MQSCYSARAHRFRALASGRQHLSRQVAEVKVLIPQSASKWMATEQSLGLTERRSTWQAFRQELTASSNWCCITYNKRNSCVLCLLNALAAHKTHASTHVRQALRHTGQPPFPQHY